MLRWLACILLVISLAASIACIFLLPWAGSDEMRANLNDPGVPPHSQEPVTTHTSIPLLTGRPG